MIATFLSPSARPMSHHADATTSARARVSKTQRKKTMHALQALGEALTQLSCAQLDRLALPEPLRVAIDDFKRIRSHEARRRQLQYIGRLMREVNAAPLLAMLEGLQRESARATALFHRVEAWRDRLLEDDDAAAELLRNWPMADGTRLRTLVRNARREARLGQPPKSARQLFRALRALFETEPEELHSSIA